MRILVINNLLSGTGEGTIYDYVRNFLADGDEVTIRASDGTTDFRTFLHDADEFDIVVVAGGDGTVSSCIGLLADTGIPVLPFPSGTANILSVNLESPTEPHALVKMTRESRMLDFDLGEIEFPDGSKRGFTIMAGAGYDAKIMEDAQEGKKAIGQMAYFTSAFANAAPQFSKIVLDVDGNHIETEGVGVLLVNFSRIQFDLSVLHENNPRDGLFDVVVLNTKDAIGLLPALFAAILDRSGDFPDRSDAFEVYRGSSVSVSANPPMKIQADGDALDRTTPFSAKILPKAARYVVSDQCLERFESNS